MKKRYKIFISTTFEDLKEERQAILNAVLELNHIPAGMELLPAADDEAWQLIKNVIDASDYFVLVIGGCYGSLDEIGIGYTEKEYDYAVETNKPVILLLHKTPDNMLGEKTGTDESIWKRLLAFRDKVEKRHTCVSWITADDLKAKVLAGISTTINELEKDIEKKEAKLPKETAKLAWENDIFEVHCTFITREYYDYDYDDSRYTSPIRTNRNQIFAAVAPKLINEMADNILRNNLKCFLAIEAEREFKKAINFKDVELRNIKFREEEIESCIVRFLTLGLIKESIKHRSVRDSSTYWTLTPYGNTVMVQEKAPIKSPLEEETIVKSQSKGRKGTK